MISVLSETYGLSRTEIEDGALQVLLEKGVEHDTAIGLMRPR